MGLNLLWHENKKESDTGLQCAPDPTKNAPRLHLSFSVQVILVVDAPLNLCYYFHRSVPCPCDALRKPSCSATRSTQWTDYSTTLQLLIRLLAAGAQPENTSDSGVLCHDLNLCVSFSALVLPDLGLCEENNFSRQVQGGTCSQKETRKVKK